MKSEGHPDPCAALQDLWVKLHFRIPRPREGEQVKRSFTGLLELTRK